ncbi:MAG: M2 family metallopeptidase [Xanthomonadales bacterium]|nr:M2 family metallopeptidase [Xanthomonadales bacterium]
MKLSHCLLALAIGASLAGCNAPSGSAPANTGGNTPAPDTSSAGADALVARVNETMVTEIPQLTSADWLASTYINDDSAAVASAANERWLAMLGKFVAEAARFDEKQLSAQTARALKLLRLGSPNPAPADPAKLSEVAQLRTRMEGAYGAGKFCTDPADSATCRNLGELSDVLASSRDYDAQLEAWQGWHTIAPPLRQDYQRFAELVNEGAHEIGFADAGELWRSGYDMSPAEVMTETDRLWGQVQPLYEQLHCYVRDQLVQQYGDRGQVDGMIPAHLTGNMWQQDWGNLWDILQPYPGEGSLDINSALQAQREQVYQAELEKLGRDASPLQIAEASVAADLAQATKMTRLAESFYTSLGMPALPEHFYQDSMLVKPRDRDVVCHASAWPMDTTGKVRIKMCIKPNEEELTTIYHELGHIYYYLAYKDLPPIFQSGAHDGFHEAIGDTIVLSMTPQYLASIGLVDNPQVSDKATINEQMRMALAKVAFMPFGLLIDRWRWGVFDGSIPPDRYNQAWWELKARYQGVAPATPRGEEFFDPAAKYHVPGNTPYTRYFLAHILQFQFYQALCDAAGHQGPLHTCNFAGNPEAGKRYWAMLEQGQQQPWQQTLKELTGGEQMDASAVLDYFAPLQAWLTEHNAGKQCGY